MNQIVQMTSHISRIFMKLLVSAEMWMKLFCSSSDLVRLSCSSSVERMMKTIRLTMMIIVSTIIQTVAKVELFG